MPVTRNQPAASRYAALALLAALILAGLSACGSVEQIVTGPTITPAPLSGTPVDPPEELVDFTLLNQHEEPVHLSDFAGKPVLFYFGYTHCPDVCPLTLAEMSRVLVTLGDRAADAAFVFVTVDIKRDTPARLAEYMSVFNPAFVGLTTDNEDTLREVTQSFGVYYELEDVPETQAEYLVAHTSSTFLVDESGRLSMIFPYRTDPALIASEIQRMLDDG
jgi:protein SCO1/2